MSAIDALITACAASDDAKIKALARAAQAERTRKRGRPNKLSADDSMAMFIVFSGIYSQHHTGEVRLWADNEPLAITEPTINPTDAIARELMAYAGCSINTARDFTSKQIKTIQDKLTAELATKHVSINMRDSTTKEQITALKTAMKDLTNNF